MNGPFSIGDFGDYPLFSHIQDNDPISPLSPLHRQSSSSRAFIKEQASDFMFPFPTENPPFSSNPENEERAFTVLNRASSNESEASGHLEHDAATESTAQKNQ